MWAIILAIFVCNAVANPTDGRASRIIGGRDAEKDQFPYQASLRDSKTSKHLCGGSIISENWILSAAHCIDMFNPLEISIVVGTIFLNDKEAQTHYLDTIRKHEDFNPRDNLHDIAVLRTRERIILSKGVQIMELTNYATKTGLTGVFSGWGFTSHPSSSHSNTLQYIELNTISQRECQDYLEGIFSIRFSHVCTIVPSGQGLCTGDSGGPLVIKNEQSKQNEQHGISIWGIPCGKGFPDVFTSVSFYRAWIKVITKV